MTWTEVLAPAKINLFLELTERRPDGFHELETVMTTVGLCDQLYLRRRPDQQINLFQIPSPNGLSMPLDSSNLIWRSVELLRETTGQPIGIDIAVHKRIPAQGGLGGGSSDAASTLLGINRIWQLGLSTEQLVELANQMGSDIAFFLHSHTAVCRGRGEQVSPVSANRSFWTSIAMPPQGLSTAEVFQHSHIPAKTKTASDLLGALSGGRLATIGSLLTNRLQEAAEKLSPWVSRLADTFNEVRCAGHQLTGSGSAYFGLFASRGEAIRATRIMKTRQPESNFYCVPACGLNATLIKHQA